MSIHPSHIREWRPTLRIIVILAVLALVLYSLPHLNFAIKLDYYLPIHTLLELIAIATATTIFAVGWNAPQLRLPRNILILACLFLGVAILTAFHMLSFIGMPDLITPASSEKSIYFWLAASTMSALAILAVAILPWHANTFLPRILILTLTLFFILIVFFISAFHIDKLPQVIIEGQGPTQFKAFYDYGTTFLYLLAAVILFYRLHSPRSFNASSLIAAALTAVMSKLFLSSYVS